MPHARRVAEPVGAAPGPGALRAAALAHVARYSCSEAGLVRVLERRIARWARRALDLGDEPEQVGAEQANARAAIAAVVAELVRIGALSDTGFARTRARVLSRGGGSRRAIAAHLAGHGIEAETVSIAIAEAGIAKAGSAKAGSAKAGSDGLDDTAQRELAAALMHARKRRIGPFAMAAGSDRSEDDSLARRRALGALARAGFTQDVAAQALDFDRHAAEVLIARLRGF